MLHIVHVSTGGGVAKAVEARARGVDVTLETCPHYLFFTEADLERIGVAAKCAPPLREPGRTCEAVAGDTRWAGRHRGVRPLAGRPCAQDRWRFPCVVGRIAGIQSTLAVLLERGVEGRRIRFEQIAALVAAHPAARFRIPAKGAIAPGNDADLLLLDPSRSYTLSPASCTSGTK